MTTVTLMWVGDLNQDKRMQHSSMKISDDRYRPKIIEVKENQKEIKIGRLNSTNPPNYLIESCINKRMISRNHATIERLANGGFMLYDHSMNGTYINYMRVSGGVTLKHGDIVCFGHLNGANLKPGEDVTPFFSDLKYQVYIGSAKDSAAIETSSKRHISQSSSLEPSPNKLPANEDKTSRSKKPISPQKSRRINDDGDDEDEVEISSSVRKSEVKKSNGQSDAKKHLSPPSPPASKKSSSTVGSAGTKHRDNQRKQLTGRFSSSTSKTASATRGGSSKPTSAPSRKPASFSNASNDNEDDAEDFHYDTDECSARPCKQPDGSSIDWIQCDKCTKWYHVFCLGVGEDDVAKEVFYCRYCKKH